MKTRMKAFISVSALLVLVLICSRLNIRRNINIENVEYIQISIEEFEAENLNFKISEKENLEKCIQGYRELGRYKDQKIKTWTQDVFFKVVYKDGEVFHTKFKDIREPEEYLQEVLLSEEAIVQNNELFLFNEEMAKGIMWETYLGKKVEILIEDEKLARDILKTSKEYTLKGKRDNDEYYYGIIRFLDSNGEVLASTGLSREEEKSKAFFKEQKQLYEGFLSWDKVDSIIFSNDIEEVRSSDQKIIEKTLNNYYDGSGYKSIVHVEIILKDGDARHIYGSFYKEQVPKEIEALFENYT